MKQPFQSLLITLGTKNPPPPKKVRALEGLTSAIKCSSPEVTHQITRRLGVSLLCASERGTSYWCAVQITNTLSNESVTRLTDLFIHLFTHLLT